MARYGAAANEALNAGASPQQIDKALEKFGLAMGIYRMGDLAGLDIGYAGRKRRKEANPEAYIPIVADPHPTRIRFSARPSTIGAAPACTITVDPPSMVISTGCPLHRSRSAAQVTRPSALDPPVR